MLNFTTETRFKLNLSNKECGGLSTSIDNIAALAQWLGYMLSYGKRGKVFPADWSYTLNTDPYESWSLGHYVPKGTFTQISLVYSIDHKTIGLEHIDIYEEKLAIYFGSHVEEIFGRTTLIQLYDQLIGLINVHYPEIDFPKGAMLAPIVPKPDPEYDHLKIYDVPDGVYYLQDSSTASLTEITNGKVVEGQYLSPQGYFSNKNYDKELLPRLQGQGFYTTPYRLKGTKFIIGSDTPVKLMEC